MEFPTTDASSIIAELDDSDTILWRYINAVGDLEEESDDDGSVPKNNNSRIAEEVGIDPRTAKKKGKKLQKKGFIRLDEGETEQHLTIHSLTEKGNRLYKALQPLFTPIEEVRQAVNTFRSRTLRYPDTDELSEEFDIETTEQLLASIDAWEHPNDVEKQQKAEALTAVYAWILHAKLQDTDWIELYQESEGDKADGAAPLQKGYWVVRKAAKYREEHHDIIERFDIERRDDGDGFRCHVPEEMQPYTSEDVITVAEDTELEERAQKIEEYSFAE